jgi:hypothetical protein
MEAAQESNLPSAELADAVGPEAEPLGLDLLSVAVVLVVLAADIPPHGGALGRREFLLIANGKAKPRRLGDLRAWAKTESVCRSETPL